MMIGKKAKIRAFTLLEICICLMILSIVAGFLGVHVKDAIDQHRFHNSVARMKLELQKMQMFALSHQCDFKVSIFKKDQNFFFRAFTDEPRISKEACKKNLLAGVSKISIEGQKETTNFQMNIYSSGRIEPAMIMGLHRKEIDDEMHSLWLDLKQPIQIKICDTCSSY